MSILGIVSCIIGVIVAIGAAFILALVLDIKHEKAENEKLGRLWYDRKRPIFGLPLSYERYSYTDERLFVSKGLFSTKEDEVRLYRILDISLERTLFQKMFNVGSIIISSSDKSQGTFALVSVKNPKVVKENLSELVEQNRNKKRVTSREYMVDNDYDNDVEE